MAQAFFSLYVVHLLRPAALHREKYTLQAGLHNLQIACMLMLQARLQRCQHLVCSNATLEGLHVPFCTSPPQVQSGHDILFMRYPVLSNDFKHSLPLSGCDHPSVIH